MTFHISEIGHFIIRGAGGEFCYLSTEQQTLTSTKINNKQQEEELSVELRGCISLYLHNWGGATAPCWASKKGVAEKEDFRVEGFTMSKE